MLIRQGSFFHRCHPCHIMKVVQGAGVVVEQVQRDDVEDDKDDDEGMKM